MAIEINSLTSRNLQNVGDNSNVQRSQGNPAVSRVAAGKVGGKNDSFDKTGSAAMLQELEGRIAQMPVVDAQQVEAVQRALATGSFTIDPQSAAGKMLFMEISLP
ncbi:MAG: flagellar biosynthesis anti-sigma factor FlgM [Candidatus Thiodiazotropha sp. (ex Semelilucina semeliformis)]|nr:flagellar biosynthesis anti-sigma factor FlgM [Candidatus Thiodiazotropha sp. (ex Semelilucina semeliformis)]MCU7809856.1 flagellar biosynthesis anti-sigma factor FlgM [Candidatus Thiodiazotropha sp. (ex Notomyrtea botanica)]MCU7827782.1 flagellar biosynthesis anti-sigma factor FlgM [Candidatus Thiodiazotropha sp. (ex Myrtea sp. 'scaly one' KF741663)]MCU7851684.1 flagellar biosynthesis anti-sigma factor FlgM [Candidatus Thiodiazotropha sp. (ex Monitilora ramsayi)]